MDKRISKEVKEELLDAIRQRYVNAKKADKGKILDEFVATAGCHRKHAIRLVGRTATSPPAAAGARVGRRIYDEAVKDVLIMVWEASDRICGKRLKAVLPQMVDAMESHGHLKLEPGVRERLLSASASTIDRMLSPLRGEAKGKGKRRRSKKASKKVAVRTFSDWDGPAPGYLEIDFVAHCGGSMAGSFIHTLGATDVCSGWVEAVPLLVREQSVVAEGLIALQRQFPVSIRGIDSDNDGAFINDTVIEFCEANSIEFTRSRPYRKNDQAWIEQKNGSVIRRFVGYQRYGGPVAGQALAALFAAVRLYVNYFQPSFKLLEKKREGAKVIKHYDKPATPCDRLLVHEMVPDAAKEALTTQRATLDPLQLLHQIRQVQSALVALSCAEPAAPEQRSLDEFLEALPRLWQQGEARPTHRTHQAKPRNWRTRKDPFEGTWPQILEWLQAEPDATAKALFERLQEAEPGRYPGAQLRTLQRRIREWRHVLAKRLVLGVPGPLPDTPPQDRDTGEKNPGNISK